MTGSTFPTQFETNERANSRPVHLYTFARGVTVWRLTDSPTDVTDSGVTYSAAAIAHSDYQRTDESAAGEVTVTLSDATPIVADLTALGFNGRPVTCTIRQTHASGVGSGVSPTTVVRYKGRVTSRKLTEGQCELTLASIASMLDRPLLRVVHSPTCNHSVYGPGCGVDPGPFTTTGCAVSAVSPSTQTITVADAASQADGYYTAGYVTIETGSSAGEKVFIFSHVGSALATLTTIPGGLTTSDTVSITAGCDGLEDTCRTKFDNVEQFLGFPRVPQVNPFTRAG